MIVQKVQAGAHCVSHLKQKENKIDCTPVRHFYTYFKENFTQLTLYLTSKHIIYIITQEETQIYWKRNTVIK